MRRFLSPLAAMLAAPLLFGATPVLPHLASHRAVYEISLARTEGGGVVAARGRMAVEFRDVCDGWSTAQRMIADMTDGEGNPSRTDYFVTAWESKDGRTMRFDVSDRRGGKDEQRQRGVAMLEGSGHDHVELVHGKPAHFALPDGTEFPTAQMLGVLRAAAGRRSFYRHVVFQGGTTGDISFSTTMIGRPLDDAQLVDDRAVDHGGLVRKVRAWSALISFFPSIAASRRPITKSPPISSPTASTAP